MRETSDDSSAADFAIDAAALSHYLTRVFDRPIPPDQVTTSLVEGGHSNLTYFVTAGDLEFVLRRPPLGGSARTGHDVGREYRLLSGLVASSVPIPKPIAFCSDPSVIGVPFFLMEKVEGIIVRSFEDADSLGSAHAAQASEAMVATLAGIHAVDLDRTGLRGVSRGEAYLERQLSRWLTQNEALPERPAELDQLAQLLSSTPLPVTERLTVVHGDFRLDNLVLSATDPLSVRGVLDWEMATVGDPLADLGLLLMYWGEPGDLPVSPEYEVTSAPGFWTRAQVVTSYSEATGLPMDHVGFYVLLAHLKLAVIVEHIVLRTRRGQTPGSRFAQLERIPRALAARALTMASQGDTWSWTGARRA